MTWLARVAAWVSLALVVPSAGVASERWILMGQGTSSGGRTLVMIGRGDGQVGRIRLEVSHGRLYVEEVRVTYDTGAIETLRLGVELRAGRSSAEYDLAGYGRRVAQVEVLGDPGPSHGGRVLVQVFGDPRPVPGAARARGAIGDDWILLGAGQANARDIVRIGAEAGRFSAVALHVSGGRVVLARLSIVFPDGRRATYPVNKEIPDGTFTPGLALDRPGAIDRVEMTYLAAEAGAVVEIHGRPVP